MRTTTFIKCSLVLIAMIFLSACNDGTKSASENRTKESVIVTKLQPSDPTYTVYEDAEDGKIERWKIYDKDPEGATVSNVYDDNQSSQVIELSGDGTHNGYMIGSWGGSSAWNNREDSILEWSMKCSDAFRIYIRLETKKGNRYIEYSSKDSDDGLSSNGKNIRIGLKESSRDGTWQTFSRELSDDLLKYESDNELIAVNGFLIKASARVDNIRMLKSSKIVYEDAQTPDTNGWSIDPSGTEGATISNIYSGNKKSNVIKLTGDALNNSYILGEPSGENAWEQTQYRVIKWSMNYGEDFEVLIHTQTTNGERYFSYTAEDVNRGFSGNTIHHGLGAISKNENWTTFIRDLESDLKNYESNNTLLQVNAFMIRGSGEVDDIEMLKRDKIVYGDSEDGTIGAWRVYDKKPEGATITSLYDADKGSNVVEFKGDGTHNGYVLGSWSGSKAWYNRDNRILKWSMNYSEEFRISIRLETKQGSRYLEYTPSGIDKGVTSNGKTIRYGLGVLANNGTWQTFVRDLEADLKAYQSDNEILAVNGFFIKGSGRVDDVEMMLFSPLLFNNIAPTITLNGYNPTKLLLNEAYVEEGVVVTDDRDSNIDVTIEDNIDITQIGQYTVIYTATDSVGNIATKSRDVFVLGEDTEAPVINLVGGNPTTYQVGESYTEEGVFATDDVDNHIDVIIGGDVVNTNQVGTYIVTYSATDRVGNSTNKIRKVEVVPEPQNDSKYSIDYKGLTFYQQKQPSSSYQLDQLSNEEFNALSEANKLIVADKLLSTLFFGYPYNELQAKIDAGNFMDEVQQGLNQEQTDRAWLESYILDTDKFKYNKYTAPMEKNLNRFYAMKELDSYFFNNWIAYTLTQTILFSPAYELDTAEIPNVSRVYNSIVTALNDQEGLRFITYKHMMSEDNWRRFRSPEDNGREMLEIYNLDFNDAHVPISAKALQNWSLNPESNTLVVELNENIEPLNLFGTIIFNGDDFYREMVKSNAFIAGVTRRLVDFFFLEATEATKVQITNAIVASNPESWQDILQQMIFSEAYLINNNRGKRAEETFFSLAKKMDYQHNKSTASKLRESMENMHQASMKYKLGKLDPVPLDTLSFANYHKYIREYVLTRKSDPKEAENYEKWGRQGWSQEFIAFDKFEYNEADELGSLDALINLIFKSTVARSANAEELALFHELMRPEGKFTYEFNIVVRYDDATKQIERRERNRNYVARVVLEYIARLEATYKYQEVK